MALSCDSVPTHKAFTTSLGGIAYPVVSDWHPKGRVTEAYGVLNPQRGAPIRSVFLIDRDGVVRWKKVYERGLPDVQELLVEVEKIHQQDARL